MRTALSLFALVYGLLYSASCLSSAPGRQPDAAGEMAQRAAITRSAQLSFISEDFPRLEEMSARFRSEKSRTPSGLWHLTLFYTGIDALAERQKRAAPEGYIDSAFEMIEGTTQKWMRKFPDSPAAHIVHAGVLITHGWAHRGGDYASKVKPESWAPFRKYIAMAREHLEKHKEVASRDPRWYEIMLTIARAQSWERDEFEKLLEEAVNREPLHYQTYFMALEYLMPKWHGDLGEIETFAQDATSRTQGQEGQGMYARIYWYASQSQFANNLFEDSQAVWPRMKAGFEDVVARYPDPWNLNNYARFACLARDKGKTKELLERTQASIVPEAWTPESLRAQCAAWVARP
jgi:hypothetical protein